MNDDRSTALYDSGRSLLERGQLDEAIHDLEQSAALLPHFKTLELLGEAWLKKGIPLRAVVPLAAATSLNNQVRAPSLLAEAFLALGEELDAHRIAKVALGRDANNHRAQAVFDATLAAYRQWSGESA
jgi:tetratricopeptide (TPR) repeat protein